MRPIADFDHDSAAAIIGVFADIDDTLTTDGWLPAASYAALEALFDAGLFVAPITGRPAGWCDMVARFFPVNGVVGENGAFYFAYDRAARKMRRRFFASSAERASNRRRLDQVGRRILRDVPGSAISADQLYREADLAIDFCEDVAPTAVLCFIFSWTEFLFALTLTQTQIKTVPVVSTTFVTSVGTAWGNMAALGAAAIIPAFIFVLAVQKHLVRGLTMGSLKQ